MATGQGGHGQMPGREVAEVGVGLHWVGIPGALDSWGMGPRPHSALESPLDWLSRPFSPRTGPPGRTEGMRLLAPTAGTWALHVHLGPFLVSESAAQSGYEEPAGADINATHH